MISPSDFNRFTELLKNKFGYNLKNVDELHNVAGVFENNIRNKQEYKYSISNLIFEKIDLGHNTRPQGIEDVNIEVSMNIEYSVNNKDTDPLNTLSIQLVTKGLFMNNSEIEQAIGAWHFDKHMHGETNFTHPLYHCNFGGFAMTKENYNYGNLLLLDTPRIASPPMDFFLTVDFVLHNFYKKETHKILTQDSVYKNIIRKAQKLLWKPYFDSLATNWNNNIFLPNLIE